MAKYFFVSTETNGNVVTLDSNATTWGELVQDIKAHTKLNPEGMSAIDAVNKVEFLSPDSPLPVGGTTIALQPVKVKAGLDDFDADYTYEEVDGLSYADLKAELKAIRIAAVEEEDDETVTKVGNYTQLSVADLKVRLKEVYEHIGNGPAKEEEEVVEVQSPNTVSADLFDKYATLEERLLALEMRCGIYNTYNADAYVEKAKADVEAVNKILASRK